MVKHSDDPKPLVDDKSGIPDGSQSGVESNPATDQSKGESKGVDKKEKKEEKKEKKESMSIHSAMDSSMVETSEDERQKELEAQKAASKKKKGFSQAELEEIIDVELSETTTLTFLHIPGVIVNADTEEHVKCVEDNKTYEVLKQNKIGSDSYTVRGS